MAHFLCIQEIAQEYLGVEYLSAILKREGHQVTLCIEQRQARILLRNPFLFYYNNLGICAEAGTSLAMYQSYPAIGIQGSK